MVAICRVITAAQIVCIGDFPHPCKGSVAARGMLEVKDGLIRAVHCHLDRSADGIVMRKQRSHRRILQAGVFASGEQEAVICRNDLTGCIIAQFKFNISCVDRNRISVIGRDQWEAHRLTVYRIHGRLSKLQCIRGDNGERLAADDRVTGQELHLYSALLHSCEHTVFRNRTDGFVHRLPYEIRRKLRGVARSADAGGSQPELGIDGQIIISRSDQRMVKFRRGRCRGNDHQRRADRALVAVRRTVYDGERIAAFLSGDKGRRSAAVKIDGSHAAGIEHDLRQLFRTAAGRKRLLTAVEHHQDDLALSGDTHTGAGMTAVIIVCCAGHDGLSILDQINAAADSLLDLVFIGCVIAGAANHGGSILQNRKEVFGGAAVILDTIHDQRAAGSAGRHIIKVCIDADHCIVVLDVVCRIGRIGMTLLGRRHLIGHAGHCPALARIVGVIIGVDAHILPGDIRRGNVVDDLLVVLGQCVIDRLRHTGRDRRRVRGKHRIVGIIRLRLGLRIRIDRVGINGIRAVGIASQIKQIIRKCIAAGLAQRLAIGQICQRVRAFQRTDEGVAGIRAQHLAADAFLGNHTAEARGEEIGSASSLCELRSKIILDDLAQRQILPVHLGREIKRVQIAIKVRVRERVVDFIERTEVHTQIFCADICRQRLNILLGSIHFIGNVHIFGAEHQVGDITGPAAHIGTCLHNSRSHPLRLGIVGHIHCAEHMAEIDQIAVGQTEVFNMLERRGRSIVRGILRGNIVRERLILLAADHLPRAGGIALHTRADIVDDQRVRVFTRMLRCIRQGIALQSFEAGEERRII